MKIVWTKLALKDLQQVRNYILKDHPQAANDMLERIGKSVDGLLAYQNLGRPGRLKGTRELMIVGTPYLVPYRIKKDQIQILAVMHGARRWPDTFE